MRRFRLLIAPAVAILVAIVAGAAAERGAARAQATADLAISWSKTPKDWKIPGGTAVRYTITVSNHGPNAANGIELDVGMVTEKATIFAGFVGGGAIRCTKEDVIPELAFFVHCPIGSLAAGASQTATLQLRASKQAGKTGGAILVAAMTVASADADDPDGSNSTFIFDENDPIQYSIVGTVGGGSTTKKKIRAKVLIAPFGSQSQSSVRYRRVEVFHAPPGSRVKLSARGVVETGTTNGAGKLPSRKLVNRTLPVGTIFTVQVTKPGRIGDLLRIKAIAGGAVLASRRCIPPGGSPRRSCG